MSIGKHYVAAGIVACIVLAGAYYAYTQSIEGKPIPPQEEASVSSRTPRAPVPSDQITKPDSPSNPAHLAQSSQFHAESESTAATAAPANTEATPERKVVPESRTAVKASNDTKQPRFDVERQFVDVSPDGDKQSVMLTAVTFSLTSDFQNTVRALQDQSLNDTTVGELSDSYRSAIEEQLAQIDPNALLNDFACGIQICFGQINMVDDAATWQEWQKTFNNDSRTQSYIFTEYNIILPDGSAQYRFSISIDPQLNSVNTSPFQ
jgi:hypothetical protein